MTNATIYLCWADVGGRICCGRLVWSKASGQWRSACPKCGATGMAAVGERNTLDAAVVATT
jgi:hypothetical protein